MFETDALVAACESADALNAAADRIKSMIIADQYLVDKYCIRGWESRMIRGHKPWDQVRERVISDVAAFIEADMRNAVRRFKFSIFDVSYVNVLLPFSIDELVANSLKAALNGINWVWIAEEIVASKLDKLAERGQ